jgi:hypothetical protein
MNKSSLGRNNSEKRQIAGNWPSMFLLSFQLLYVTLSNLTFSKTWNIDIFTIITFNKWQPVHVHINILVNLKMCKITILFK